MTPSQQVTAEMVERARQAWLESASDYTRLDESIRAALTAALSAMPGQVAGWMPIETAPKDSKARLVWCPDNQCTYCVSWSKDGGPNDTAGWAIFGGGWRDVIQHATHWQPLPSPPPAQE